MNIWKILRRVTMSKPTVNEQSLFYHFIWGSPSLEEQRDWVHGVMGLLAMLLLLLTCPWQTFLCKALSGPMGPAKGPGRARGAVGWGTHCGAAGLRSPRKSQAEWCAVLPKEAWWGGPDTGCFLTWSQPCLSKWALTPGVQHRILMSGHPALKHASLLKPFGVVSRSLAMSPAPSGEVSWLTGMVRYRQ